MPQKIDGNRPCTRVVVEFCSQDYADRVTLPILEFQNRETITTYKVTKYTKSQKLRQSYDPVMNPTDYVYSMSFLNIQKDNKDQFKNFYEKYAGQPVWLKDVDCTWRFGYILNDGIVITLARDNNVGRSGTTQANINCGQYEFDLDFLEIPRESAPPDCEPVSHSRYLTINDTWTPPAAPSGSTGYSIEYQFLATTSSQSGTGDAPTISIDASITGFTTNNTGSGCPVFVTVRYKCPESPIVPNIDYVSDGLPRNDFIQIATLTFNATQLNTIDLILQMIGVDFDIPKEKLNFGNIYDEAQAFLLANPDYVLDVSRTRLSTMDLINTLTNLKGLDASYNLITGGALDSMFNLSLTFLDLSYNFLGGADTEKLKFMRSSLKHIDLSHNYLQQIYLYGDPQAPLTPWEVDFVDFSYNTIAQLSTLGLRAKVLKITNNTFPTTTLWNSLYANGNGQLAVQTLGNYFEDLEELNLNDTQIKNSLNDQTVDPSLPNPDDEMAVLFNTIMISKQIATPSFTLEDAIALVTRDDKWEVLESTTPHEQYDPDLVFSTIMER